MTPDPKIFKQARLKKAFSGIQRQFLCSSSLNKINSNDATGVVIIF